MQILLIAATKLELVPSIDFFERKNGRAEKLDIAISITGTGLLSTTYSLMRVVGHRRPDCIIQAGIAGSFIDGMQGKLMAIKEDMAADMGVYENGHFRSVFELQLADPNEFPFSNGFLSNPFQHLLSFSGLEKVRAISVNEITTDKIRLEWYEKNLLPVVESMEGAAFHYVCLCEKIPFLQIRAISNRVGERDKAKWNIKEAVDRLNAKLISLVMDLSKYDKTYLDETFSRI